MRSMRGGAEQPGTLCPNGRLLHEAIVERPSAPMTRLRAVHALRAESLRQAQDDKRTWVAWKALCLEYDNEALTLHSE